MINQKLVNKINSLLDKGITYGLSEDRKLRKMCLEQVISYALGEGFTDEPSYVGKQVRRFVICLNDQFWSSASARAEGMRKLAIAQLGSDSLDQKEFRDKLLFAVITKMLPAMFRDLGEEKWEKEIKSLEGAKDLKEARDAAAAYHVYAYTAVHAAANAVAADDAAVAADAAADATKTGDKYRSMIAHLAVEVLKDMKSPGCQFI